MIAATFLYQPLFSLPLHIYSLIYTLKIYNSPRKLSNCRRRFLVISFRWFISHYKVVCRGSGDDLKLALVTLAAAVEAAKSTLCVGLLYAD